MPAAMHLAVVVSLFAVTVCQNASTSSTITLKAVGSTTPASSLPATKSHGTSSPAAPPTLSTHRKPPTATTTAATSEAPSSPHTSKGTGATHSSPSAFPQTSNTDHTPNGTASPGVTAATNANSTTPAPPPGFDKGDIAKSPGLVAILCIFFIILAIVLVVAILKCVQSRSPSFERLEDLPLSKVNEESPFARYSK